MTHNHILSYESNVSRGYYDHKFLLVFLSNEILKHITYLCAYKFQTSTCTIFILNYLILVVYITYC